MTAGGDPAHVLLGKESGSAPVELHPLGRPPPRTSLRPDRRAPDPTRRAPGARRRCAGARGDRRDRVHALGLAADGRPSRARPHPTSGRVAAAGGGPRVRRGRALPPHVHDAAALVRRDAAARARAVAPVDELEPAPARVDERGRPRRLPVRDAPAARGHLAGGRDRHGPGGPGVRALRRRADRGVGPGRGAGAAAALVRQPPGHDGGPAGVDLRPRRPDPHPGRLPGRVEQAPCGAARVGPAGGRRARSRRMCRGLRRRRRRLAAHPRGVGRPVDLPARGGRPPAQPAHPDARRLAGRLRPHDPSLVAAGAQRDGGAGPRRPAGLLRVEQPALARQPRHADRARRRGGDRGLHRDAWPRVPAQRARALPRRPRRGLVGELPLLRRPAAVGVAAGGRRGMAPSAACRARARRHPHLQPRRAARVVAGDGAREARPGRARPPARGHRRASGSRPARR